ncbi:MAG: tRNA modification GTPase, partial [Thermomicrobiales bacterium]|nr:tRNA modification GTPase [Thermomicrobiales bacterium]
VSPIAGTTRDVVSEEVTIDGIAATLLDTAGIAASADLVEQLGIERSRRALTAAAAAVLVLDGTVVPTAEDLAVARLLSERLADGGAGAAPVVVVVNKRDLPDRAPQDAVLALLPDSPVVELSSLTGVGIEALEDALGRLLRGEAVGQARPALITARQRAALDRALEHIRAAAVARRVGYPLDLLATDVRAALRSLGEVTGEAVDEAVLTEIFSRFCIGK